MLSAAELKEHTLNRVGYGPGVWQSQRYDQLGFAGYVAEQIGQTLPPIANDDVFIEPKIERGVMEQRQLESVLLDFWFNHFNVRLGFDSQAARDNPAGRTGFEYQNEVIGNHVLGSFASMLEATAKSGAMLWFLDNRVNRKPQTFNSGQVVGYNENYARELMELHTLGVDGGYTEADVQNVTKILTGWWSTPSNDPTPDVFAFRPERHDTDEKTVMGVTYPAGRGIEEGEELLAFLAAHPSTATFIARKLCARFIGAGPPQQAVQATAQTFLDSGGDLTAVMTTILNSTHFSQAELGYFRSKVKPPHRYITSALMAMGATSASQWTELARRLRNDIIKAGDTPYYFAPPTGYPEAAAFWISTSSVLTRFQSAERIAYDDTLRSLLTDRAGVTGDDIAQAFEAITAIMIPGGVSTATENAIKDHATAAAMTNDQRISAVCHMLLCSPEFLRY